VGVLGELLETVGYIANRPQAPETLEGMARLMLWGPLGCGVLGLLLISRYPLDARLHGRLVAALARRAGRAPA
jgi:GPH family glycoside/pentoside/hexuronide:cation symporter